MTINGEEIDTFEDESVFLSLRLGFISMEEEGEELLSRES